MLTRKATIRVHVRWMIQRDMLEVLNIEEQSSEFPWTEDDFLCYRHQSNCIGMVAEQGEKVVGFMVYELNEADIHILNFAVHPDYLRQRIGTQMVEKLVSKLSYLHRACIEIEVRETNINAQHFFKKQDFIGTKVLRGFYEDTGEDAFLMQYRIADAEN